MGGEAGHCAAHPERAATETCSRCGDYVCSDCRQEGSRGAPLCARCPGVRASRTRRFGANLIDVLIVGAPGLVGARVLLSTGLGRSIQNATERKALGVACIAVAGLVQLAVMAADRWRRSIGKRTLGIRVAREDGSVPALWRLVLLRNVIPYVLGLAPGGTGTIWTVIDALCIFGGQRRCLHDIAAGTNVVDFDPGAAPLGKR